MKRCAILSLVLLFAAASTAAAQGRRREPRWEKYETRHYKILHTCSKIEASYLGDWMEFVYKAYTWMIKVRDTSGKKFTIKLYKDRKEFLAYGNPEGAGAYYVPRTHLLCGFYDREAVFPYFAHEGTHQFVHMAVPDMMTIIPTWFNEGIADCMGSSKVINKSLHICMQSARIGKGRTYTIQKALKEGKAKPLEKLFKLTHREFMQDASLHYAQSWSFVHFLFCFPHVEQPKKRIPSGRYKPAVVVYFDLLRKGTPHAEAWKKALEKIGRTTAELEAEWKKYVLETLPGPKPDDPFVGVGTAAHRRGGVVVTRLVPGAPAEKSGLQVGDRIIYFDKRKVKDHEGFIKEIKRHKPGDEVQLRVVRGRKTVKITLKLGRRGDR